MSAVQPLLRRVPIRLPGGWDEWAAVAVLVPAAVLVGGVRPLTAGLLWLAAVTPRLIAVDTVEHRLPDAVLLPGYPIVLAAVVLDSFGAAGHLELVLGSGVAYGALLLVLHLSGGMGLGDVKLAPLLGLLAGALGPAAAVASPLAAFLVGGVVATVAALRGGLHRAVPFGPSMLLGAWGVLLLAG
jgi:leader peptidase (prepilin peptidase)/N-methyltransferase